MHALKEICPLTLTLSPGGGEGTDFGDEGFADGVGEAPVTVGVLDDGVLAVVVQTPAGDGDDLLVTVECLVGAAEVQRVGRGGGIYDL